MCLNKNEKAMCLKNENTKKQNEMELEPDLCEIIWSSSNSQSILEPNPEFSSRFFLIITPRGRFPPNSNNQIITIQF